MPMAIDYSSSAAQHNTQTSSIDEVPDYSRWLKNRQVFAEDATFMAEEVIRSGRLISFHVVIRLSNSDMNTLADTLDTLGVQTYPYWHLDILSMRPPPDNLNFPPNIKWHTQNTESVIKLAVDKLVSTRSLDYIIEIPAGTRLDFLYFWRLAQEINHNPEHHTFFVDDRILGANGLCQVIRFKPGCNIEWLLSSDRAGPICVRRDIWLEAGGTSPEAANPWFSLLLRVAAHRGWDFVKHIPDTLLSYPSGFPGNTEACLHALIRYFGDKKINAEIVPVSGRSWCIRYPLPESPKISIAIISRGELDLLTRCFNSILEKTNYPHFEIICAVPEVPDAPDLDLWLAQTQAPPASRARVIRTTSSANFAARCNAAVEASSNEFVIFIREDAVVIQEEWLNELLRTCCQMEVAAVAPCVIAPGTGQIQEAGGVIGFGGLADFPYRGKALYGEAGYLDLLSTARDVSVLSGACLIIRTAAYRAVGGMDETLLGDFYADTDLCIKLRRINQRLIYQPLAVIVCGPAGSLDIETDAESSAQRALTRARAKKVFSQRWLGRTSTDPFWNSNLSLSTLTPVPETEYVAQWQSTPTTAPRILARTFPNRGSWFRIDAPLAACQQSGLVTTCYWPENDRREPTATEILRLAPDSIVVHHYLKNWQLAALEDWSTFPDRPFVVYAVDDLMTQMAATNPLRSNIPANCRTRLKYALERCDRMVASTAFLADIYSYFISDIRVVPNRLAQDIWLPLTTRKRTSNRPRIGWAGGVTHLDDLMLLKEVIEATRSEADWVFFGMCPDELRPLITEYHSYTALDNYPRQLAALNLDIAVAPLANTPFNRAKSNLRLLEYGVLGIPVVCTDIDPYHGSPTCLVANRTKEWIKAIRERIFDADAREKEGMALREWVCRGYLLENHVEEWLDAHLPKNKNQHKNQQITSQPKEDQHQRA